MSKTEEKFVISKELLLQELTTFARTCVTETANLLGEMNPTEEQLIIIADQFAEKYLQHLEQINREFNQ